MHHEFDTPRHTSLYVEIGAGSVEVIVTDRSRIVVDVEGPRAEEFTISQDGDQVAVVGPRQRVGFLGTSSRHRVTVQVPTGTDLEAQSGSADVTATGEFGACHVKTGAGEVRIGRTHGPTVLETGSGSIVIEAAGADLRTKAGSGDVTVGEVTGTVVASAGSGSVRIGALGGAAALKAGSGDLVVEQAGDEVSMRTGSGDISIARMRRGRFTARSGSGDVTIGIPSGTPVWTDINTASGRLRSGLPPVGAPDEDQDSVEVRITTASGDITLQPL